MNSSAQVESEISRERLTQIFNTALISTRSDENAEVTSELYRLMEKTAFSSILNSIQSLAQEKGVSEVDAAREIIRTFRKIDRIWTEYLIQEGTERLKSGH